MESTRKNRSFANLFAGMGTTARDLVIEQPKAWLVQARERMRDLPKTNFDLGCDFAEQGKWMDAIFRFRVTLYLQPNYPLAYYNLGCCYFRLGRLAQARSALKRALQQKPDHGDAIFMLSAVDPSAVPPNLRPTRMPRNMVIPFFAGLSAQYDQIETQNQYQGGKLAYDAVKPLLSAADIVVVDLGSGSGLAARPWRTQAKDITAIDFTAAMEASAASVVIGDRKLYERIIDADIAALPETLPGGEADLVLAINVVQFVGELTSTIMGVARLMKPGGIFAVTLEPYTGQGGYGLSAETGRFGHSPAYVKQIAANAGLVPLRESTVNLYPGTPASLLLFSKGQR